MQVFVTKTFDRWMRKSRLSEERILLTALETFSDLGAVDLGSPRASTVGIFFFTGFIKMSVQI